jgi:hypothetical protein
LVLENNVPNNWRTDIYLVDLFHDTHQVDNISSIFILVCEIETSKIIDLINGHYKF